MRQDEVSKTPWCRSTEKRSSYHLLGEMGKKKRLLFWGMLLALIIGIFVSQWLIIKLSYTYGGVNLNSWYFVGGPKAPWLYTADKILHPEGPNGLGWLCKGIGAVVMFGSDVYAQ